MTADQVTAGSSPAFWPMLRRNLRIIALILIPALLISLWSAWQAGDWSAGEQHDDLPAAFPSPLTSWDEHIAAIDRAIATHRQRAVREPTDWLSPSAEAGSWLDRAVMTGRWQDYAAAEAALAQSMERAPPSNRPHPLAARLALALHRNDRVEGELQAARADLTFAQDAPQADAAALRGDVALYGGDWQEADRLYRTAMTRSPDAAFAFRRAFITERTQDSDAARQAWLNVGWLEERPSRRMLAAIAVRLAGTELARGQWDEAAQWINMGERLLPGDWHIIALSLQMQALNGDLAGAINGMAALAQRHDLPELWDALAAWRQAQGDAAGAQAALARAEAGWAQWLARYPEAAAGHAAEHALIAGDRGAAVTHARANYRNRPYGDAGTLLATALSAAGEVDEARAVLSRVTATGWRNAESDRLAFELAALAGDGPAAEAARAAALARNPRAFDPAARLILFGLH